MRSAIELTKLVIKKCEILNRLKNHEYSDDKDRTKDIQEMMLIHQDIIDLRKIVGQTVTIN